MANKFHPLIVSHHSMPRATYLTRFPARVEKQIEHLQDTKPGFVASTALPRDSESGIMKKGDDRLKTRRQDGVNYAFPETSHAVLTHAKDCVEERQGALGLPDDFIGNASNVSINDWSETYHPKGSYSASTLSICRTVGPKISAVTGPASSYNNGPKRSDHIGTAVTNHLGPSLTHCTTITSGAMEMSDASFMDGAATPPGSMRSHKTVEGEIFDTATANAFTSHKRAVNCSDVSAFTASKVAFTSVPLKLDTSFIDSKIENTTATMAVAVNLGQLRETLDLVLLRHTTSLTKAEETIVKNTLNAVATKTEGVKTAVTGTEAKKTGSVVSGTGFSVSATGASVGTKGSDVSFTGSSISTTGSSISTIGSSLSNVGVSMNNTAVVVKSGATSVEINLKMFL